MTVTPARSRRARNEAVDRDAAWRSLVDALAAGLDAVAEETTARVFAELPGYTRLSRARVLEGVRSTFRAGHRGLVERRAPRAGEQLPNARRCGEAAALQGVRVDELLHAYRIGLDVLRERVRADAPAGPYRDAVILEALEIVIAWNSAGMVSAAASHRETELEIMRAEEHQLATFIRGLLLGGIEPGDRRAHLELYGIDPERSYHVVCARPADGIGPNEIRRLLRLDDTDTYVSGLVTLLEGDIVGLVSELPSEQLPIPVGASASMPVDRLDEGFQVALRALDTVNAAGMPGVHELGSLGVAPAVLADAEVGDTLTAKYVAPLERLGRSGGVILDTVDCYLAHDGALSATARALDVHPNTIRYRVGRFESITGASLRRTEQLVEIWWALCRRRFAQPVFGEPHENARPGLAEMPETGVFSRTQVWHH